MAWGVGGLQQASCSLGIFLEGLPLTIEHVRPVAEAGWKLSQPSQMQRLCFAAVSKPLPCGLFCKWVMKRLRCQDV